MLVTARWKQMWPLYSDESYSQVTTWNQGLSVSTSSEQLIYSISHIPPIFLSQVTGIVFTTLTLAPPTCSMMTTLRRVVSFYNNMMAFRRTDGLETIYTRKLSHEHVDSPIFWLNIHQKRLSGPTGSQFLWGDSCTALPRQQLGGIHHDHLCQTRASPPEGLGIIQWCSSGLTLNVDGRWNIGKMFFGYVNSHEAIIAGVGLVFSMKSFTLQRRQQ